MKRKTIILIFTSIIFFSFTVILPAQEIKKSLKKKEAENKELLIKALEESEKARDFYNQNIEVTGWAQSENLVRAMEDANLAYRNFSGLDEIYIPQPSVNYAFTYGGSQNSTSLRYTRSLKEATFTKDVKFNIDNDVTKVSMSISGSCKAGEVRVKILMPGGKSYTEVLLDEYGSVSWSKTFTIEEDDKSKTGEWVFMINSKEATGNFSISIRSF